MGFSCFKSFDKQFDYLKDEVKNDLEAQIKEILENSLLSKIESIVEHFLKEKGVIAKEDIIVLEEKQ